MQLIAQTEEAKARIAAARSTVELRGALRFLAEVASDGASLCARLRDELEPLGRPPPLASQIDRADATISMLIDGLSALARDALDHPEEDPVRKPLYQRASSLAVHHRIRSRHPEDPLEHGLHRLEQIFAEPRLSRLVPTVCTLQGVRRRRANDQAHHRSSPRT